MSAILLEIALCRRSHQRGQPVQVSQRITGAVPVFWARLQFIFVIFRNLCYSDTNCPESV